MIKQWKMEAVLPQGRTLRVQPWATIRSAFSRQNQIAFSPEGRREYSPGLNAKRSTLGRRNSPFRPAYTLLEVLLALSIALLLLGGLYVSMDVQIRLAQAGRERIEESALARALLTKIAADVSAAATPIRANAAATGSGGVAASSSTAPTTGSTGGTASTDPSDPTTGTTSLTTVTPFNGGIQGSIDQIVLFTHKLPGFGRLTPEMESAPNGGADIRRITYWLIPDVGLARQAITRLSAEDEGTQLPPDVSEPQSFVISNEVVGLEFRFFDGTSWMENWDGTTAGEDGSTPIGPPRAVEILLKVASPQNRDRVKTYRHVVAIQAANAQPTTSTTTAEDMP